MSEVTQPPPRMFSRPTDPPEQLPSLRGGPTVSKLHTEWARRRGNESSAPKWRRAVYRVRSGVLRRVGGGDVETLADLVRAVDALAERCDELGARLSNQSILVAEIAENLGSELTQLRATVDRLASNGRATGRGSASSGD